MSQKRLENNVYWKRCCMSVQGWHHQVPQTAGLKQQKPVSPIPEAGSLNQRISRALIPLRL